MKNTLRRLVSSLLVCALLLGTIFASSISISAATVIGDNLIVNGGAEDYTNNWDALYGGCTLGLGYSTVKSGSLSLKVSARGATYNGPVQTVAGFEKGATYNVSAAVRYNLSENASATGNTTFIMSIIYGDGTINNMASVTTAGNTWATIEGQYTVPSNADVSNVRVFIETAYTSNPSAQDLVTFFIDDVSVCKVTEVADSTTATGATVSDGWYYIKSPYANKYLQTADSTGNNGVNVEIGTGNGSEAQRWYVTNVGDGYVTLQNACGAMLDVVYGDATDGANIQTYSANGATAQQFKFVEITSGVYGIVTRVSDDSKGLDLYNWGTSDGVNVCQWGFYANDNQLWTLEAYVPETTTPDNGNSYATLNDGWYYIKSPYANKYLQVANNAGGNGVNVEIGTGSGVAGQKWYLTNVGDGYITLKNGQGYMLDVVYGEANNGTNIQTYSANGATAQQFKLIAADGAYGIVTRVSDDAKCLDIYDWNTADGTNVCQWDYYGSGNQVWQFEATTATTPTPSVTVETSTYHKIGLTPAEYLANSKTISTEYCPDSATQRVNGVAYGSLTKVQYYSNTCGRVRNVNIFLPADYSASKKYPVLYVLHGYWGNEDSMCDPSDTSLTTVEIISNLIASGEAEDMIVVFPYIYASATSEYCTGMDATNNAAYDNFINELFNDLMPFVENTYSIAKGRENTAITGFSMGGRESLYIGFSRPDVFGYIGAACPAPGVNELIPTYNFKFASTSVTPYTLLITAGDNDTVVYSTPEGYHNTLVSNGVDHIWTVVRGGYHGGNSIRSNIYNFCRMIFKNRVAQ